MTRWTACLALFCCCATAHAQTLADRVPADAIAYLGWNGADSPSNGYAGSHLQAIIDASGFAQLRDQLIPQLMQKITQQSNDHGEKALAAKTALEIFWRHPTAVFFAGVSKDANGEPAPKMGLICKAATDSDALMTILNAGVHGPDAAPMSRAFVTGDCTVFLLGYTSDDAIPAAADTAKSLKNDGNFVKMTAETEKDPIISAYLDVTSAFAQIDNAVATGEDEQAKTMWPKARDASGLTGIKHFAFGAAFNGRDWQSSSFVDAPTPRGGLLAMLEPAPIDATLLARVPSTATMCSLGQVNLGLLIPQVRSIVAAANPGAADLFDKGLGLVQMMIGRSLQRDVLEPLGSQWAAYSDPSIPFATITSTQPAIKGGNLVIVNKLIDPAKASQGWTMLSYAITNAGAGLIQKYHLPISTAMTKDGDQSIFTITTQFGQPSWTMKDGFLYLGMSPEGVIAATKEPNSATLITQQPTLVELAKQLEPAGEFSEFKFANLPVSVPQQYAESEAGVEKLRPILEQQSITLPEHILPPLDKLLPELTPALSVSWADASGWHSRSREPFPASSPQSSEVTVGVTALSVSILLPSLNRARETANRVKCASNERQIGQACLLYSNDHQGQYPPGIADILSAGEIGPEVFLCPSSNTSLPNNFKAMAPADLAAWVTDHTDYVYVGGGMTSAAAADAIVCYEKPGDHHHDGMNILFGDGHVEFVKLANAVQLINDQHKTVPTVKLPDVSPASTR